MHPFQASVQALQSELIRIGQTVSHTGLPVAGNARFVNIMRVVDSLSELAQHVETDRSDRLFELLSANMSTLPHAFDYILLGLANEGDYDVASRRLASAAGLLSVLESERRPDQSTP